VSIQATIERGDEEYLVGLDLPAAGVSVSERFRQVVDELGEPGSGTPAGFRIDRLDRPDGSVVLDLVRDIGCDRNGRPRPTPLIFSVDSVNPYEIAPCAGLIGNLTCNPGIVYDLFLNDERANVGNRFGTLEEVLGEVARILGPGCDISVELNDPFVEDFGRVLEEVHRYEEIVTKHRLVVKVPHTGPVNRENLDELLHGEGRLGVRYDRGATADYMRGHNLALRLEQHGYRINFTLMFEPHQTPLALQARPYFINAFIRHRLAATKRIRGFLAAYESSEDAFFVEALRDYMIELDYLAPTDRGMDLLEVKARAVSHLHNRSDGGEGADGLDAARQALRWLRASNLPETRLIICSMEGDRAFPDVMAMLTEPEFLDFHHRVLVTTEPAYLARWTGTPQVVAYQRRFLRAARSAGKPDR
jgi:Transaldolase/Fructose-6-phosphate aldolase